MKSKKAVWLTILVLFFATVGIACAQTAGISRAEKAAKADAKFVQDLRLYFAEDGQLLWAEPIDKEKYTADFIKKHLYGQKIGGAASFLIGKSSPFCTYWYTYQMGSGYFRI